MTLQEKFENAEIIYDADLNYVKNYEQIADDYAIGFAYYLLDKNDKPNGEFTIKELLEIYKKTL